MSQSFISKSVNYSQTERLQKQLLLPLLTSYNDFLLKQNNTADTSFCFDINTGMSDDRLIPNNNKKFYVLITDKHVLDPSERADYNILYFFPDNTSTDFYKNDPVIQHTLSDGYLETDRIFTDSYLLEGYLYTRAGKSEYLLTDILCKNGNVVDLAYELRVSLLDELVYKISRAVLRDLNNHLSINLHPMFQMADEHLVKIFKHNFIYAEELCTIERVSNFKKTRFYERLTKPDETKTIVPGAYTDVYNVYNATTNNPEGILYIRGIRESMYMKELFGSQISQKSHNRSIQMECVYNTSFKKWQPKVA